MSVKGRNQRYIFKVTSSQLRRAKWQLSMSINEGQKNNQVVALGESQLLRWLDELNGIEDCENKINKIHSQIEDYRKQLRTDENIRPVLKSLYQQLDHYQFKKDYCCVVIDSKADYKKIYKDGFVINGIRFRRLLGTSGGIKLNTIVFINEKYLSEIKRRIANGRNMNKEFVPAKLEAYQALVCSSSIPVSMPKGVICVPDCYTHFKADVIELDDSESDEPKMTYVKDKECEQCANDGYGLGMPQLLERWGRDLGLDYVLPGCVIRNSFCKGTVYPIDFRQFAQEHGFDTITDSWGCVHNVNDVELVLTESMLKLWDSYSSIDEYLDNCKRNHYTFAITKASEKELENARNMNYQFLQSYDFTDDDINELVTPTINEIKDVLQNDWRKTVCYTKGVNLNDSNIRHNLYGDFATALMIEPKLIGDSFVQSQLQGMIHKRIQDAKIGVLKVDGCYSLISGDPYCLCQSMFGLDITGLLKSGEVYSYYWIKKGVKEAVMFRAPMTVHSNIKKMKVVDSDICKSFYRYMNTIIIFNNFDTSPDAMNGFDFDGDCVITTSNEVLLRRTRHLPAVQCIQYKANKKNVSEDDIVESNMLGFGNAVGAITNKVTSMFEVQARFPKDSEEYKILDYRTMCGQQFQQESIDAIKGIKAKPIPSHWVNWYATKPNDNDSDEIKEWKEFQRTIVADKKPYFFRYVYPSENTKWLNYQKTINTKAIMQFGMSLDELINLKTCNQEQKEFLDNYWKRLPLGIAPCTINKICRKIEDEFKREVFSPVDTFDYSLLKSLNSSYSKEKFIKIEKIYKQYLSDSKILNNIRHSDKISDSDVLILKNNLCQRFKKETALICPNKKELCDILIDICYSKSNVSKRFVWDICGDVIVDNLLERHNYCFYYPIQDKNGSFEFGGIKFKLEYCKIM